MNKVILIGNTGSDVEVINFDDGNKIGKLSLATNERYKNAAGEKVVNTTWHNLIVSNKVVDIAVQYCPKGSKISIEGKIVNRSYDDKDGNKRYITEIRVLNLELLGGAATGAAPGPTATTTEIINDAPDDDLPF